MSKIDEISHKIAAIADFEKFSQVKRIEERAEFAILSDYKGQSHIVVDILQETLTIQVNGTEIPVPRDDTKLFRIYNAKQVVFVPIDGKHGLLGFSDSYCDVIIFDESHFCFIEFKLNATSIKKSTQRRAEAIGQLSNTIDFFDNKLAKNYEGLALEAYVGTPLIYPRNDATWKKLAVGFLENYRMPLYETNEKICQ